MKCNDTIESKTVPTLGLPWKVGGEPSKPLNHILKLVENGKAFLAATVNWKHLFPNKECTRFCALNKLLSKEVEGERILGSWRQHKAP
jgi:hypothetical protein